MGIFGHLRGFTNLVITSITQHVFLCLLLWGIRTGMDLGLVLWGFPIFRFSKPRGFSIRGCCILLHPSYTSFLTPIDAYILVENHDFC